jgi:hypothetical protein
VHIYFIIAISLVLSRWAKKELRGRGLPGAIRNPGRSPRWRDPLPPASPMIRIACVIDHLKVGGAQRHLVRSASALDRRIYAPEMWTASSQTGDLARVRATRRPRAELRHPFDARGRSPP